MLGVQYVSFLGFLTTPRKPTYCIPNTKTWNHKLFSICRCHSCDFWLQLHRHTSHSNWF